MYQHFNYSNARNFPKMKTTAHAIITVYTGELSDDDNSKWDMYGEYYITDSRLADAINAAVGKLDVFSDVINDENKDYKMPANAEDIPNLFMKKGTIPTKRTMDRAVACCAYNATDGYLQHWLGRKLDNHGMFYRQYL